MTSSLLRKLSHFADLNASEIALVEQLTRDVRNTPPKRPIISDGDRPESLHLIVRGWAARVKILPSGRRQILAFLVPGDFCDLHAKIVGHMDHSVVALDACKIAWVQSDKLDRLTAEHSELTRALWWGTLLDEAILRNWLINMGQRDAYSRIANVLCEMHARMAMVDLADGGSFDFPVTQEDLGSAAGITTVHTNRTLKRLRDDGLIKLSNRRLTILDYNELARVGGFDPSYLHLKRRVNE